jgi:nitrate/nitrite transporter NarK
MHDSVLTGNVSTIRSPATISCLVLGCVMLGSFVVWVDRQERNGGVALIKNSLWRNKAFSSVCISVFLSWGAFNACEALLTFLFQDVQKLSGLESALRFLPCTVSGAAVEVVMALNVHKIKANWALLVSMVGSATASLLLAVMARNSSYWEFVFPAVVLNPVGCDVLYTISNLVITAEFPPNTQGLAGGVFNTASQIGKSVGLALSAIIAASITRHQEKSLDRGTRLFEGYQAGWWFTCALTVATMVVVGWGLKGIGKVGLKRE